MNSSGNGYEKTMVINKSNNDRNEIPENFSKFKPNEDFQAKQTSYNANQKKRFKNRTKIDD